MKKQEKQMDKKVEKKVEKRFENSAKNSSSARQGARGLLFKQGGSYMEALHQKSPYLRTILDPSRYYGIKIPDSVTTPSFPIHGQHVSASSYAPVLGTGSSAGNYYWAVAIAIGSIGNTASGYNSLNDISFLSAVASDAITWGGAGFLAIAKQYAATVAGSCSITRPVSLLATAKYLGNALTAAGRLGASYYPGGSLSGTLPTSITSLAAAPYYTTTEAGKLYIEGRYVPSDPIALAYAPVNSPPTRNVGTGSPTGNQYGVLILWGAGLPSGTAFEYDIYENLEGVPANATTSINATSPSWSDPIELAGVSNALAEQPEISIAQNPEHQMTGSADVQGISGAKRSDNSAQEGPGFLDSLIDFGIKALPSIGMGLLSMFG
jgi:hypothetical protein